MIRPVRPSRRARRCGVFLLLALVLSAAAVGCRRPPASVAGRLTVIDGQAEIGRPGEERREITGSRDLKVGDGVRIREGSTVVRLGGDRELELRPGSDLELRAMDGPEQARPTLVGGDLLVRSPGQPVTVTSGGEDVVVQGVARISRGLALLVATYEGSATVTSAAKSVVVPALREVAIPAAGLFPVRPSPLDFSPDDTWDQRYLSGAIGLSAELLARSRGFSAQQTGGDTRTVDFFRALLPGLAAEPAFQASLLDSARPPGETLVGAAIVLESTRGSFADRWASVFGFHDAGAPWGLVALDQGVNRIPLLAAIETAVGRSPISFALPRPGSSASPPSPPPPSTSRPPSSGAVVATTVPVVRPAPPKTITPSPTTPTTVSQAGPLNTGAPVVDNTVNGLVNTLSGLLTSLGRQ